MRCYDGCPDSQLQAHLDEQSRLGEILLKKGLHVTWFPNGEFYMAFDANHRSVSEEHTSLLSLLNEVAPHLPPRETA